MEEGTPVLKTSSSQVPSSDRDRIVVDNKTYQERVVLTQTDNGEIEETFIEIDENEDGQYQTYERVNEDGTKEIFSVKQEVDQNTGEIIQYITEAGEDGEEYETVYIDDNFKAEPIIIEIAAEEAQEAITESEEDSEDEFEIIGLTEPKLTYFEGIRGRKEVLKEFTCPVCKKIFSQKGNLLRHYITHTGKKPFACSLCGQKFSQKSNLQKHIATHNGDKRFACGVCNKAFVQKANLLRHLRIHTGEKPFECDQCGHKFTQKANLDKHKHLHSKHTQALMCQYCSMAFSTVSQKIQHVQLKHTNNTEEDSQEVMTGDYRCKECPAKFRSVKTLKKHMTYHM